MLGNAGPGMHCACQFVPVSVCFGPCWVSCSDKVFCNSRVQREDISHFLLQTPAVLCALLGKVLMMENPRLGSTPGFSASENKMCWWTGCDLCGRWSLQTIPASLCFLCTQRAVSSWDIAVLRQDYCRSAGGTPFFQQGDGGCGSLQESGHQHDASSLDRNSCPSSQEVTICASLWHRLSRREILTLVEAVT